MKEMVQQYNETVVGFIEKQLQEYRQKTDSKLEEIKDCFHHFFVNSAHEHYINFGMVKVLEFWFEYFSFGERDKMDREQFLEYLESREGQIVESLNKWELQLVTESSYLWPESPMKNLGNLLNREITQRMYAILKTCLQNVKFIRVSL